MIERRHAFHVAALLAPLAFLPLLLNPVWALAASLAAIVILLAWKSVVYPVVAVGLVPVLVGFLGSNPLPDGTFTYLFFGWTVLAIGFAVVRGDVIGAGVLGAAPVVLTVALGGLLLVQLAGTASQEYGAAKLQLFGAQNLVLLFAGIVIGANRKHLDLFLRLTAFVAFVSALTLIQQLIGGQALEALPARFAVNQEENPIFLGRSAADGLLIAVYLLLAGVAARNRMYALALLPTLAVALVAAGSRGPVVALAGGLTVLLVCLARSSRTRRRIPWLVAAVVLGVLMAAQLVPGAAIERSFSVLVDSGSGVDSNGRLELWRQAGTLIASNPLLGIGTGGFEAVNPGQRYPHNLLLEAAVELGILGVLLVLGVIASTLARLRRTWRHAAEDVRGPVAIVAALFVAAVINAMLSGDITVNAGVWLIAGLALGVAEHARRARRAGLLPA